MRYDGDMIFNAADSGVTINSISAVRKQGFVPIAGDFSNDILTLSNIETGDYIITFKAEQTGEYDIKISCTTDQPTTSPSKSPSKDTNNKSLPNLQSKSTNR
eukprot:TRINITY_DN11527_c0_g1_i1.p1 TRINITY_DN11527_c0_g1~~TRINITY_DN11527_c0_g1_i1.p1  ORF type:complete len:102 (+),score=2.33 TRINITY_DN11527_c0_g1_i1:70-375(+)